MLAMLYGVMVSKQVEVNQYQNQQTAEKIIDRVSFEVEMALVQGEGYQRNFTIPSEIGGENYKINISSGSGVMNWSNETIIVSSRYYDDSIIVDSEGKNQYQVSNTGGNVSLNEK